MAASVPSPSPAPERDESGSNIVSFADGESLDENRAAEVVEQAAEYRESMQAYAFSILRRWPQAQDVVQESLLVVYHRWEDCEGSDEIWPWLRRIVQLKCYEALRRKKKRRKIAESTLHELIEKDLNLSDPDGRNSSLADEIEALQGCFAKLTPRARKILHDFYIENREGSDIASDHDLRENTVWSTLRRSRQQLRKCMEAALKRGGHPARTSPKSISRSARNTLDTWFSQAYPHPSLLAGIERLVARSPGTLTAYTREWSLFANALAAYETKPLRIAPKLSPKRSLATPLTIAAGIAILLAATAITLTRGKKRAPQTASPQIAETTVPRGEKRTLRIDQGATRLNLGSDTSIVPVSGRGRLPGTHLKLDRGTITADVAPQNPATPFRIDTEHGRVTVVGTRLRVRALDRTTFVGVAHGEVAVEAPETRSLTLTDGESVRLFPGRPPMRIAAAPRLSSPWSPWQLDEELIWDFSKEELAEAKTRVATGSFAGRAMGPRFHRPLDIVATSPVALPSSFRIAARIKLAPSDVETRVILSNSVIGLGADGIRFGINRDRTTGARHLKLTIGDGRDHRRLIFRDEAIELDEWHDVAVEIDTVRGKVTLSVDGKRSSPLRVDFPRFRKTGPLYFGGQDPSRSVTPLHGAIDHIHITRLDP